MCFLDLQHEHLKHSEYIKPAFFRVCSTFVLYFDAETTGTSKQYDIKYKLSAFPASNII